MPGMPELPVPTDQMQVEGDRRNRKMYQTHRGPKPKEQDMSRAPRPLPREHQSIRYEGDQQP